jgi:hypothetical protein
MQPNLAFPIAAWLGLFALPAAASQSRVEAALTNITTLERPGQDGLATFWDGNAYIQCRSMVDRSLRCEAAGTFMQPSLARVLLPAGIARLGALGWQLDPSFGNYVQTFPPGLPVSRIAEAVVQALRDGYAIEAAQIKVESDWIASEPCPPRNGPTQNLAGLINDSAAMARFAVRGCAYRPREVEERPRPRADMIDIYRARVSGEIQRLRVNLNRRVYVAIQTGAGYVQCAPQPPQAIYCEAQSAESWPLLTRILTPDRLARLKAAGYAEPGRTPNYWKTYPLDSVTDRALAEELLGLLHDVYGYDGAPKLVFDSERKS